MRKFLLIATAFLLCTACVRQQQFATPSGWNLVPDGKWMDAEGKYHMLTQGHFLASLDGKNYQDVNAGTWVGSDGVLYMLDANKGIWMSADHKNWRRSPDGTFVGANNQHYRLAGDMLVQQQ